MKGYTARLMSLVAMFGLAVSTLPANAGGVVVTASVPSNGEINSMNAAGYATTTLTWTSSAAYLTGATIQVVVSPALTSPLQECVEGIAGQSTAIGTTGTYTTSSFSTTGGTFTLTGDAGGTSVRLCLLAYVSDGSALLSARNFSESIVTTGATVDYGAAMFYVNGGNDVLVSATVPATLSFKIADTANLALEKHTCNLGVLTPSAVNTCDYRLKVVTNAQNGFVTSFKADHDLATAAYATLTNVGDGTVSAGAQEYGFALNGLGTGVRNPSTGAFSELVTPAAAYAAGDDPVPTDAFTGLIAASSSIYIDGVTAEDATMVQHKASITASTNVGLYQQTVTYRTVGNF